MSASTSAARAARRLITSGLRTVASAEHKNAYFAPGSAAACNPRPIADSCPCPRTSSRTTCAESSGSDCPCEATTKTGWHRCPTTPTTCSTIVVGAWEPGAGFRALVRPSQGDAPAANTTPASEAALEVATISVHSPGVATVQQRLQGGAVG